MRRLFLAALLGVSGLAGCGGGSSSSRPAAALSVTVSPFVGQTINQGSSLNITASVFPGYGQGVAWSLSGSGALSDQTPTTVTYTAPSGVSDYSYAVVTATSLDSPNVSGYVPLSVVPFNAFPNVQPVSVDGGPVHGQIYRNGAFTSVTVCAPGSLNCKVIDGILVDTGSSGLRILASALPPLPILTDSSGNTVSECVQSADQSYMWGSVAVADVRIAGEVASSISIQAIADSTNLAIPSDCTSNGAGINNDNQQMLGANGILGVGLEPQDCGLLCAPVAGHPPPGPAYYSCSSSSCSAAFVASAQQVTHPALFFMKDNNGVELELPPVSGSAATVSGSLTFGIGTQTNNILGDATVFTVDLNDHFSTTLASTGQTLSASFIDSGSSGFFFPDNNLTTCPGPGSLVFFCPASLTPMTTVNTGASVYPNNPTGQSTINFSADNADNLLSSNPTDAAFSTLTGPNGTGACAGGGGACSFDWGLPFFYGRNVFVSIRGQAVPPLAPTAPWWAYTTGFTK